MKDVREGAAQKTRMYYDKDVIFKGSGIDIGSNILLTDGSDMYVILLSIYIL